MKIFECFVRLLWLEGEVEDFGMVTVEGEDEDDARQILDEQISEGMILYDGEEGREWMPYKMIQRLGEMEEVNMAERIEELEEACKGDYKPSFPPNKSAQWGAL